MKKEFLIKLGGKDYPKYAGVLDEAHEKGLVSIKTELIRSGEGQAIVKAVIEMKDGKIFEGLGDADESNTGPMTKTALIRMAETRAKGRALRDAINCGDTLADEIPEGGETINVEEVPFTDDKCEDCKAPLDPAVVKFCKDNHVKFKDKLYCFNCQKKINKPL